MHERPAQQNSEWNEEIAMTKDGDPISKKSFPGGAVSAGDTGESSASE